MLQTHKRAILALLLVATVGLSAVGPAAAAPTTATHADEAPLGGALDAGTTTDGTSTDSTIGGDATADATTTDTSPSGSMSTGDGSEATTDADVRTDISSGADGVNGDVSDIEGSTTGDGVDLTGALRDADLGDAPGADTPGTDDIDAVGTSTLTSGTLGTVTVVATAPLATGTAGDGIAGVDLLAGVSGTSDAHVDTTGALRLSPASGDRLPAPGPAGTLALGVGVVAAAAVTRQWAAAPSAVAGVGAALAAVAPATPGWSLLDRLVRMVAPFRYSRYDDSDPLEHEAREAVYEMVQDSPGAYLSEVSDGVDLPLSTARHHVRVLEREDLVTAAKVRGKRRFYPAYTQGVELAAAMNDDATAAILDAIARLGAASVSDLAEEVQKDPSTISHHLQRLEGDELIVRERDGRAVMNKLAPDVRTALEPEREPVEPPAGPATASGAD